MSFMLFIQHVAILTDDPSAVPDPGVPAGIMTYPPKLLPSYGSSPGSQHLFLR